MSTSMTELKVLLKEAYEDKRKVKATFEDGRFYVFGVISYRPSEDTPFTFTLDDGFPSERSLKDAAHVEVVFGYEYWISDEALEKKREQAKKEKSTYLESLEKKIKDAIDWHAKNGISEKLKKQVAELRVTLKVIQEELDRRNP
jgi:hypothetical protein